MATDYKKYFKLPPDVHYLNCASFSPNLYSVIEAGIEGIEIKSNPHLIKGEDFAALVDVAGAKLPVAVEFVKKDAWELDEKRGK